MVDIEETPKLFSMTVYGTLVFSDELDIHLKANHILIHMGVLRIGT